MRSLYFFVLLLPLSCQQQKSAGPVKPATLANPAPPTVNLDSINPARDTLIRWLSDRLFKGDTARLGYYVRQRVSDSCDAESWELASISRMEESFEGIKSLGDINNNGIPDTLFILPSFRWCEDGDSYCFSDTSLPRLFMDGSRCLHLKNVFVLPDIDEDGVKELGTYYSSCASSYKALLAWRLHAKKWEEIGHSAFHILTQDPDKVEFSSLVKKISRNRFRMKNFYDGKKYWDTISVK